MDEVIERQYEVLYLEFRDRYELKHWIDQATQQVTASTGRRLRADARFLLLLNFTEMVIRPADLAETVRPGEFREAARDDIRTIVGAATERAEAEEISGHALINALTSVWGRLRTVAYNVWD
jgi:hypothetical protein